MTNIKQLTDQVRDLNLPLGKYIIISGAVLAIHGLRLTNDIDIIARPDLFRKLCISHLQQGLNAKLCLEFGEVEIGGGLDGVPSPLMEQFFENATIIDGLPFSTLEDTIILKGILNRPKDIKDIRLIKGYLSKSPNKG